MEVNVRQDKGFTLIELLVSLLIISVIFLALLHSLILCIQYNVVNSMKNEAIRIAQECAEQLRVGKSCPESVEKRFRNFSVNFSIEAPDPANFISGTNQAKITVSYTYKGRDYSYSLTTIIYRE